MATIFVIILNEHIPMATFHFFKEIILCLSYMALRLVWFNAATWLGVNKLTNGIFSERKPTLIKQQATWVKHSETVLMINENLISFGIFISKN